MEKNGGSYVFDINKINDFVFKDFGDRTNDVEITDSYEYDGKGRPHQVKKEVRETKVSDFSGQTTRYDLVKTLMDILNTVELDDSGQPMDMTLGQVIALNTLDTYGLITKN